jgi:hypothetical protein
LAIPTPLADVRKLSAALLDAAAELAGEVAGDPHLETFAVGGEVVGYAPSDDPPEARPS